MHVCSSCIRDTSTRYNYSYVVEVNKRPEQCVLFMCVFVDINACMYIDFIYVFHAGIHVHKRSEIAIDTSDCTTAETG